MDTGPVGAPTDGVSRGLAMWGSGAWQPADNSLVFVDLSQWSSTRVVGYTLQLSGSVNVSLTSTGFYGPTVVSSAATYQQVRWPPSECCGWLDDCPRPGNNCRCPYFLATRAGVSLHRIARYFVPVWLQHIWW